MATQEDVRRIALALPETLEEQGWFKFLAISKGKPKAFAWVWLERIHPKKARVPNPEVLAVRVESLMHKEALLATNLKVYFTEPHYKNYPAVLVRLSEIDLEQLQAILEDAWQSAKS